MALPVVSDFVGSCSIRLERVVSIKRRLKYNLVDRRLRHM